MPRRHRTDSRERCHHEDGPKPLQALFSFVIRSFHGAFLIITETYRSRRCAEIRKLLFLYASSQRPNHFLSRKPVCLAHRFPANMKQLNFGRKITLVETQRLFQKLPSFPRRVGLSGPGRIQCGRPLLAVARAFLPPSLTPSLSGRWPVRLSQRPEGE